LEYNWAYGTKGIYLKGKYIFNAVSTGGSAEAYSEKGYHGITLRQFFLPYQKTANLCNMIYLPPFQVAGTHNISAEKLHREVKKFKALIEYMGISPDLSILENKALLNEFN
jgi:glutathione-regulated potassium-efflux system ancillary protein KefG